MSAIEAVIAVEVCGFCKGSGLVSRKRCAACNGSCRLSRECTRSELLVFLGFRPVPFTLGSEPVDPMPGVVSEVRFAKGRGSRRNARVIPIGRARKRGKP